MHEVEQKLKHTRSRLIRGFFNESLPKMNISDMRPALLVDVDSDLYVSAKQALSWLFKNHIAIIGTLVRYDDWNHGNTLWGEPKAHKEITEECRIKWDTIERNQFLLSHRNDFYIGSRIHSSSQKISRSFFLESMKLSPHAQLRGWKRALRMTVEAWGCYEMSTGTHRPRRRSQRENDTPWPAPRAFRLERRACVSVTPHPLRSTARSHSNHTQVSSTRTCSSRVHAARNMLMSPSHKTRIRGNSSSVASRMPSVAPSCTRDPRINSLEKRSY